MSVINTTQIGVSFEVTMVSPDPSLNVIWALSGSKLLQSFKCDGKANLKHLKIESLGSLFGTNITPQNNILVNKTALSTSQNNIAFAKDNIGVEILAKSSSAVSSNVGGGGEIIGGIFDPIGNVHLFMIDASVNQLQMKVIGGKKFKLGRRLINSIC